MSDEAAVLQDDELVVLDSIYPGLVNVGRRDAENGTLAISLDIPIVLPAPVPTIVTLARRAPAREDGPSQPPTVVLTHLPPLSARIILPPAYPLSAPPRVLAIRAPLPQSTERSGWLSNRVLTAVKDKLRDLWYAAAAAGDGAGVLWTWWDWIGSGAFLSDLGLEADGTLALTTPPVLPASTFHLLLKTHDAVTNRADFEDTAFPCAICFETRKGKKSVQLPQCGCVFCSSCLASFWRLAIEEGTLDNVACPSVACVKVRAGGQGIDHTAGAYGEERADGITGDIVESVVGPELRKRWQALSEKRLVDTKPEYTFCPRDKCQAAVPPGADLGPTAIPAPPAATAKVIRLDIRVPAPVSGDSPTPLTPPSDAVPAPPTPAVNSRWANFRSCPRCEYKFCILCRMGWHGAHSPCSIRDTAKAVREYRDADEDGKRAIEARLGPRGAEALHALVREYERDLCAMEWMREHTTECPACKTQIEKSEGCNHMTCGRCGAHFCYRCGKGLSRSNPYDHFNDRTNACFGKLFDYDATEDHWIPMDVFDDDG